MSKTDETAVLFDTQTNTMANEKGSTSVLVKTMRHEKLRITDAYSSGWLKKI
jgi:hypothetical protein